jgi:hypothetical protein
MAQAARKATDVIELPKQPQVGDKVRLKEERMVAYAAACKAAGWANFDQYAVHVVTREDPFNPGGGRRLFVDGPPYAFASTDVKLAWNTEDERRRELRRRGWKV